jgi:hypothetical protein
MSVDDPWCGADPQAIGDQDRDERRVLVRMRRGDPR